MLENEGTSLRDMPEGNFTHPGRETVGQAECVFGHEGSGSGGYSDHVFKYAAKELFGDDISRLEYKVLR